MPTWNHDVPTLANQIAEDIPDIEENFQELHDWIEAFTNGTLGTTAAANVSVDKVLSYGARGYIDDDPGQNLVVNTATEINLDAESHDAQSEFGLAGHRYTAGTAGHYLVVGSLTMAAIADGASAVAMIYKNNAIAAYGSRVKAGASGYSHSQVADIMSLEANDYIELFGHHNDSEGRAVVTGSEYTYLAVHKLSG